jgi:DNA-binding FrmR family transcriptional regulator
MWVTLQYQQIQPTALVESGYRRATKRMSIVSRFCLVMQYLMYPPRGDMISSNSPTPEAQVMSEHEHNHPHTHQSHEAIIKRLKRADGHLRGIITMIEEGRECVDIAQQLHAVEKAVCQAKRTLIQDHIDHCLEDTVSALNNGERAPLEAFKQITKYL